MHSRSFWVVHSLLAIWSANQEISFKPYITQRCMILANEFIIYNFTHQSDRQSKGSNQTLCCCMLWISPFHIFHREPDLNLGIALSCNSLKSQNYVRFLKCNTSICTLQGFYLIHNKTVKFSILIGLKVLVNLALFQQQRWL